MKKISLLAVASLVALSGVNPAIASDGTSSASVTVTTPSAPTATAADARKHSKVSLGVVVTGAFLDIKPPRASNRNMFPSLRTDEHGGRYGLNVFGLGVTGQYLLHRAGLFGVSLFGLAAFDKSSSDKFAGFKNANTPADTIRIAKQWHATLALNLELLPLSGPFCGVGALVGADISGFKFSNDGRSTGVRFDKKLNVVSPIAGLRFSVPLQNNMTADLTTFYRFSKKLPDVRFNGQKKTTENKIAGIEVAAGLSARF